ncbi:MAG: hypothetical protein FVQ77_00525 [Cytophagales bacterium]|nr:hypothetical protein [Cytophagales bacterium]
MSKILNASLTATILFFFPCTNEITGKIRIGLKVDHILVVSGVITEKEEIWNRRSNTKMGRPDKLIGINLKLKIITLKEGSLPVNTNEIDIAITNQKLLATNSLAEGDTAIFYLNSINNQYRLVDFKELKKKINERKNKPSHVDTVKQPVFEKNISKTDTPLTEQDITQWLETPDNIPGRLIRISNKLKQEVLQKIAKKYQLKNAKVVTLVSHQGPTPPFGGYVHWGVTGTIKGIWYIWQPGREGLRQGKELIDPKRHQK